jgi:hypothetical protein
VTLPSNAATFHVRGGVSFALDVNVQVMACGAYFENTATPLPQDTSAGRADRRRYRTRATPVVSAVGQDIVLDGRRLAVDEVRLPL